MVIVVHEWIVVLLWLLLYILLSETWGSWHILILKKDTSSRKESTFSLLFDCFVANLVKLVNLG